MRLLLPLALILAPGMAAASCTGPTGADICNMARMTAQTLVPALPQEMKPGLMLTDVAIEGARVDLMLMPAADLALPGEGNLTALACALDGVGRFVKAGGSLQLLVGQRTVATVTSCPEF